MTFIILLIRVINKLLDFIKTFAEYFIKFIEIFSSFFYCSNKDVHEIEKISQQSRDNYRSKEKRPDVCNISIDVLSYYRPLSFYHRYQRQVK